MYKIGQRVEWTDAGRAKSEKYIERLPNEKQETYGLSGGKLAYEEELFPLYKPGDTVRVISVPTNNSLWEWVIGDILTVAKVVTSDLLAFAGEQDLMAGWEIKRFEWHTPQEPVATGVDLADAKPGQVTRVTNNQVTPITVDGHYVAPGETYTKHGQGLPVIQDIDQAIPNNILPPEIHMPDSRKLTYTPNPVPKYECYRCMFVGSRQEVREHMKTEHDETPPPESSPWWQKRQIS